MQSASFALPSQTWRGRGQKKAKEGIGRRQLQTTMHLHVMRRLGPPRQELVRQGFGARYAEGECVSTYVTWWPCRTTPRLCCSFCEQRMLLTCSFVAKKASSNSLSRSSRTCASAVLTKAKSPSMSWAGKGHGCELGKQMVRTIGTTRGRRPSLSLPWPHGVSPPR